jgi:hypothetical protein
LLAKRHHSQSSSSHLATVCPNNMSRIGKYVEE